MPDLAVDTYPWFVRLTSFSHGAGCGCKLSADELAAIVGPLVEHPAYKANQLVVGIETSDDAGIWRLDDGTSLVQTVDFITPIVDDAYDWGRIAAANALSDIYAMGGRPMTALQVVAWPREHLPFELLREVMRGGADVLGEAGTTIVGGHSIDDPEPKYGFAITGTVDQPVTNAGARVGDALVLTKPLGMGIVTTAMKRGICPPGLAQEAVKVMTTLNADAARAVLTAQAHAATDVTGFGLLGHLGELTRASKVGATIEAAAVPVLAGLEELLEAGAFSGGSTRNLASARASITNQGASESMLMILADAQTSGGLIISLPPSKVAEIEELVPSAVVIGVTTGSDQITVH